MSETKYVIGTIDELGRIAIPVYIREQLEWKVGKELKIGIIDTTIKMIVVREN